MPQLQNLVITDRKTTPASHTFTPRDIVNGVGTVIEAGATPLGDNRISYQLARTANGRYKAHVKYVFPVVQTQTVNGVSSPVVVRTAYAEVHFNFDQTSTEAERNDVVGMVEKSLYANQPLTTDTVVKLQGVY